jgi:hypothetical protein
MLGVHGNGLTHLLWMPATPRSAVIEMFIRGGFARDCKSHWLPTKIWPRPLTPMTMMPILPQTNGQRKTWASVTSPSGTTSTRHRPTSPRWITRKDSRAQESPSRGKSSLSSSTIDWQASYEGKTGNSNTKAAGDRIDESMRLGWMTGLDAQVLFLFHIHRDS